MQLSICNSLSKETTAVAESLSVMIQKEQTCYKLRHHYLDDPPSFLPGDDKTMMVTETDRTKIVEWLYSVTDQCHLDRETVEIAMDMVDRFLSSKSMSTSCVTKHFLHDRGQFQLLTLSAFYIAIKLNESIAFGSNMFSEMSHGVYTVDEIEATEIILLHGLSWRVNAPTSSQLAHHILSLVLPHCPNIEESTWGFILDEVRYQTQIAVRHSYFTTQRPSTVALASIFNTLEQINEQDRRAMLHALILVWNEDLASHAQLQSTKNRLQQCVALNCDGITDFSKVSRVVPQASRSLKKGFIGEQETSKICVRRSPRTVA